MLAGSSLAWAADDLDLAASPLFSGTNAKPNVLVAVDDSGSMDLETLFPTDEGWLYWDSNDSQYPTTTNDGAFRNNGDKYGYIFPTANGYTHVQAGDDRTIPPIPETAFARAADYNKAYFNPSSFDTYSPWLKSDGSRDKRPDEPANNARYDPLKQPTLDLTQPHNGTFYFERGMVIPGNGNGGTLPPGVNALDGYVCYNPNTKDVQTPLRSIFGGYYCYFRFFGTEYGYGPDYQLSRLGDIPTGSDETVTNTGNRNISYFPATFYLKAANDRKEGDASLPANYGYKADRTVEGKGPNGETLVGYEIKPDNFTSPAAYTKAIQSFANWFTFYRKRNLATRGGIVAAFDRINDIRVGSCTINNRNNLTMKDLDDQDQRAQFYSNIFNIDYSGNRGTPNREAIQHLGRQLEGKGRGDLPSIITAPCQRNFAILFTDGYSNPDTGSGVGNVDGNYRSPFADSRSNTMADIAMKYYTDLDVAEKGILRVSEECKKPNPDPRLDCETDLHMSTFGVTLNQTGTIFNDFENHAAQNNNPYSNPPAWPDVNSGGRSKKQIDDLWHATINTRGQLLNAETPAEIADKFTTALERILGDTGSATSVSLDSSSLTTDSAAYQAKFVAGAWTGNLYALPQTGTDGEFGDQSWDAADRLTNHKNPDDRVILTRTRSNCGNSNAARTTVPLRFNRLRNGCPELTETELNFVRGVRTDERASGGTLRNRNNNILGDIVHSDPLYVGAPNRVRYPNDWNDLLYDGNERTAEDIAEPYINFAQGAAASRSPTIYVGANDGMLHGFDAKTGDERIAFIPGAVLSGLSTLTQSNYKHRYYVDDSPASGDVIIDNAWHTVLVGALGAGGRSVYALDITKPDDFSENNADQIVQWEFEDDELGYSFGQPSIVRLHDGRWAAVFGNGYNSDGGKAQLFIVDIKDGSLIKRIDTGVGSTGSSSQNGNSNGNGKGNGNNKIDICLLGITVSIPLPALEAKLAQGATRGACGSDDDAKKNGLGEVFPVDLDGDFITDYIYAGDLQGNVWKFDLTSKSRNDWKVGLDGDPLFTATDSDGTPQPITTQPQVAVHSYGRSYGVMVYFGTGKYLEENDREAKVDTINTFYGIQDVDVFTFNDGPTGNPTYQTALVSDIPKSRLQAQTILETPTKNGDVYRLVSDNPVDYQTSDDQSDPDGKRGWYLDLSSNSGEMVITNSRVERDTIAFSTAIPNIETCSASGSGYFMLLNRETGGRTDYAAFDLNGDKQLNVNDYFLRNDKLIGASGLLIAKGIPGEASHQTDPANDTAYYIVPASDGTLRRVYTRKPADQRMSWREIRR
ncbi:PilC/PilY family type IV pilus protein [Salinisphaera aquimarina]